MRTRPFVFAIVPILITLTFLPTDVRSQNHASQKKGKKSTVETAVIETKFGSIEIQFLRKDAPKTVDNFVTLTKRGYYNGVKFHRIAKGFVIQGGDPTGTGSGGESIYGGPFADEIDKTSPLYKNGYKRGMVAMANRGPNTNTSQFFIMLADANLPPNYTIFGTVTKGMDVVDKIAAVDIVPVMGPTDGKPKVDVVMTSVKMK